MADKFDTWKMLKHAASHILESKEGTTYIANLDGL
jgi:hypothetical protein